MSHPMEHYWDDHRARAARQWERVTRVRELLQKTSLAHFTADYAADITLVMNPAIAPDITRDRLVNEALDRLEGILGLEAE